MFLEARQIDDLRRLGGHDACEIRTGFAFAEAIRIHVGIGIVSAALFPFDLPPLIESDNADAGRDERVIAVHLELV